MARKCQGLPIPWGISEGPDTVSLVHPARADCFSAAISHGLFGRESQAPYASRSTWSRIWTRRRSPRAFGSSV